MAQKPPDLDNEGNPVESVKPPDLDNNGKPVLVPSHEPSKGRWETKGGITQWRADNPVDINNRPDTSMFNAGEIGSRFGDGILPAVGRFALETIADPTVFGGGTVIGKGVKNVASRFGKKGVETAVENTPKSMWVLQADGKSLFNKVTGEVTELPGAMSSHGDDILSITNNPEWGVETLNNLRNEIKMSNIDLTKFKNADELQEYIDVRDIKAGARSFGDYVKEAERDIPIDLIPQPTVAPRFGQQPKNKLDEFISSEEGSVKIPTASDIKYHLMKTGNTMKSMSSALDASAFRQGSGLMLRPEFYAAARNMPKYITDEKFFLQRMEELKTRPGAKFAEDAGLFQGEYQPKNIKGDIEETYGTTYLNDLREKGGKIGRGLTAPYLASERGYIGFLNEVRAKTFDSLVLKAQKAGIPMYEQSLTKSGKPRIDPITKNVIMVPNELARKIAKYVNTASGRGDLGSLNKYGEELNALLFSPRLMMSRLEVLNPLYYWKTDPFLRKEALKTQFGIAGMIGAMNAIAGLSGNEFTLTEPTSSDFGKGKFGNTRFDTGGGHLQYIVAAARFADRMKTLYWDKEKLPYGSPSPLGGLVGIGQQQPSFLENKFSPLVGLADSILTGRANYDGTPIKVPTEIAKRFTAMFVQDMTELIQSDPDFYTDLGQSAKVASAFGLGGTGIASVQTYGSSNSRSANRAPRMRRSSR